MRAALGAVLLAACSAAAVTEPEKPARPPPAVACPAGAPAPAAPPAPRSVDAIARYATLLADAHRRTELARAECARRLRLLAR